MSNRTITYGDRGHLRSARNYDRRAASIASGVVMELDKYPGKAVQSMKDECDINVIVKRFGLTGVMPPNMRLPQYGDFSGISDYKSAMDAVALAKSSFMELPADIRKQFGHDPAAFHDFVSDERNQEKLIEMGLAKRIKKEYTPETVVRQGDNGTEYSDPSTSEDDNDVKSRSVATRAAPVARASRESGEAVKRKP